MVVVVGAMQCDAIGVTMTILHDRAPHPMAVQRQRQQQPFNLGPGDASESSPSHVKSYIIYWVSKPRRESGTTSDCEHPISTLDRACMLHGACGVA